MAEYYEPTPLVDLQSEENKLVNKSLTRFPAPYLSGLKLRGDIEINGLTLNYIEQPDDENGYEEAVIWIARDIDGWWTLPEPEMPDLTRGWGDGSYDAKGRYSARTMTLEGSILVQSPNDAPRARDRLIRAISLVYEGGWLVVDEEPVSKGAFVRLSGAPLIASVNPRGRMDFSVGLKAADPIKYEYVRDSEDNYNAVTLSSSVDTYFEIDNIGNIAVPVIFEITTEGSATTFSANTPATIFNQTTSETIEITGNITVTNITVQVDGEPEAAEVAQALEIDTYNREVLLVATTTYDNEDLPIEVNVDIGRDKTVALLDWIYLQPGVNKIRFYDSSTASSQAKCTVYWRSGWIG